MKIKLLVLALMMLPSLVNAQSLAVCAPSTEMYAYLKEEGQKIKVHGYLHDDNLFFVFVDKQGKFTVVTDYNGTSCIRAEGNNITIMDEKEESY